VSGLAAVVLTFACSSCLSGGRSGIATIDVDGKHRRALVTLAPNRIAWYPTWSPDGTRFAYVVERPSGTDGVRRVWVARADGSARRAITSGPDDFHPVWSPDGTRIAFERNLALWVVGADGGRARQLVGRRHGVPEDAAWSPDGRRIAFVAGDRLYVARADGRGVDRLPTTPAADPAWSPDGRSIYYLSGRQNLVPWVPHRFELATGRDRSFRGRPAADYETPAWTPDRRWLAYVTSRLTASGATVADLWLVRLADARRIHVTRFADYGQGLDWKPRH
jgi:Tol biopolymer transport system component